MSTQDRAQVAARAAALLSAQLKPRWTPLPHQQPPGGDWYGWLLLAGRLRGAGKTDACAEYIARHIAGPPCLPGPVPHWVGIIAPTQGDAVTACVSGPSGIKAHDPTAVGPITTAGGTVVRWPNGSQAKLYGANSPEDVERLRAGGNTCVAWLEEFAAWRHMQDAFDQLRFGLRSGPRPHWVASTTPKPKPLLKRLMQGEIPGVTTTTATMYDNPHLPQHIRDMLEDAYAGTDLGEQELYGRILDEIKNALWRRGAIAASRIRLEDLPDIIRTTVGIDPSGGAGEQGIVVTAKSGLLLPGILPGPREESDEVIPVRQPRPQHHGFVLDDRTCQLPPEGWGQRAVQAAIDWEADDLCVEVNYGGDQAIAVIRTALEKAGVDIPVRKVRATHGKAVRAQPVAALAAQGRMHHAGVFPELEDQLCLVAGTRVDTFRGSIPIESVRPTDLVLTRAGWAPIVWSGQTGITSELTGIHVLDCELWMTPNHPVYLGSQDLFVPARNVLRGQRLAVSSSATNGVRWHGGAAGGRWNPMGTTGTEGSGSSSIAPSTRHTMGRSRTGWTSTMKMRTSETIRSGICVPSLAGSTWQNMSPEGGVNGQMRGAANPARKSGRSESLPSTHVLSAGQSFCPRPPTLATVSDVAHVRLSTAVPVYNLMVADGYLPEFYANGVLVHNCTWYPELGWSPDRLDAAVWGPWHMKLVGTTSTGQGSLGGALARKQIVGGRLR